MVKIQRLASHTISCLIENPRWLKQCSLRKTACIIGGFSHGYGKKTHRSVLPPASGSGQAVVTLSGVDFYLGEWNSPESKAKYDRLIGEWIARGRQLPSDDDADNGRMMKEVILGYKRHVDATMPAVEADKVKPVLSMVNKLYGDTAAAQFNACCPMRLCAHLVQSGRHKRKGRPAEGPAAMCFDGPGSTGNHQTHDRLGSSREMIPDKVPNLIAALEKAEPCA